MHPAVKHFMPKVPFRKVIAVERGIETTYRGRTAATMKQIFRLKLECGHSVQRDTQCEKVRCKACAR